MKLVRHALVGALVGGVFVLSSIALAENSREEQPRASSRASALPDMREWSAARIEAFRKTLGEPAASPIAELRIPRLGLAAPVLRGADEAMLDRGLGWIQGTTVPGHGGNVGIGGHRDSFFRPLKDIRDGDVVELVVNGAATKYVVESTSVVKPEDVYVLAPTQRPTLTLVTCYPFYFAGDAPERFIVKATAEIETTRVGE